MGQRAMSSQHIYRIILRMLGISPDKSVPNENAIWPTTLIQFFCEHPPVVVEICCGPRASKWTVLPRTIHSFCEHLQRGSNENTNLLLRQYFPRGTDLAPITQAQLDQVSLRLNQRPRKTLGFETPASKLHASVASTV